jgi:hypothetical protein
MTRYFTDPALRRGLFDGLLVSGLIAVLAGLLVMIGARGQRRAGPAAGTGLLAGVKAGATAGAVIAAMITLTFLAVNNLFLDIVSRQHDKRVAFAASGSTSMRAYLTVTQLRGALFLIPVLAVIGAVLGLLGAAIFQRRVSQPTG